MTKIIFDIDKHYYTYIDQSVTQEQWESVPLLAWLIENVGPMNPKKLTTLPDGEGWDIRWDRASRPVILLTEDLPGPLLTEFVLVFS